MIDHCSVSFAIAIDFLLQRGHLKRTQEEEEEEGWKRVEPNFVVRTNSLKESVHRQHRPQETTANDSETQKRRSSDQEKTD